MDDDLEYFKELKKRLTEDLYAEINQKRQELIASTANLPRPLSEEQASNYANAETVMKSMHGNRAKKTIKAIVDLYSVITQTHEHQRMFQKGA